MKKSLNPLLATSLLVGGALSAPAQNIYWGAAGGTNAWTTVANWYSDAGETTPAGAVPTIANDVIFNTTPDNALGGTITIGANIAARSLTFATSSTSVLSQSGSRILTLGIGGITVNSGAGATSLGTSTNTLSVQLAGTQTWTNSSTSTLTVRKLTTSTTAPGPVALTLNANAGGITFSLDINEDATKPLSLIIESTGTGTVSTAGGNTFTGGTTIKRGTLSSAGTLGTGSVVLSGTGSDSTRLNLSGAATNNIIVQAGSSGLAALTGSTGADYQGSIVLNRDVVLGSASSSGQTVIFSGSISGTSNVTIGRTAGGSASPTVVLSGNNTYVGRTNIDSAIVVANSLNRVVGGSASSSLGAAPIDAAAGTIRMSSVAASTLRYVGTGESTDRIIEIASSGGATLDQSGSGTLTFTSNLANSGVGSRTLTLTGTTAGVGDFAGGISNIGSGTNVSITKSGIGTWRLSGTNNSYAGTTTVSAGVLEVTKLADTGLNSSIGTGANVLLITGGTLRYVGNGDSTNRALQTNASGMTLDASGAGAVVFSRTTAPIYSTANQAISITLTGNNTGTNTYGANQNNNGTGAVSLTKNGTGTWVLTGNSTNTGATTINAGTLLLNGRLANSAVALNSAILGGSGTANLLVTTSGTGSTLSPGNSPGTLTLAGGLDATAGATFVFELGTTSDVLSLGGGTLTGSTAANSLVFNFIDTGSLVAGNPYTIITFGSATNLDYSDLNAAILPVGYVLDTSFGTGGFLINGNDLQVQFAVPEPSTTLLMVGGLTIAVVMRRRRQS